MSAAVVLSIDVDAEVREVCREQLQGDWQLAAELIRFAIRRGAAEAVAARRRRGFVLRCPGAVCDGGELGHAAAALDRERPDEERHAALVALERVGGNALLWAAGVPGARLRVAHRSGGGATVLKARPGRPPRIEENAPDEVPGGFEVTFSAPGYDGRQALAWLRAACRFSPVTVTVGGRPIPQGFAGALWTVSLGRPVPGGIALTASGDAPHLWLLRHGVLATRATVPGHPPFEAVLELGEVTAEGIGPDELRRASQPYLPGLLERVGDLIVDAAEQLERSGEAAGERLCTIGLRALRARLASDRLVGLPLIPAIAVDGSPTRLSIEELRRLCDGRREPVRSVSPREGRLRMHRSGEPLLRLTAEQQRLVGELVPIRLERPEPAVSGRSWQRFVSALSAVPERVCARLWSATRPVPESELIEAEQDLLRRLRGSLVDGQGRQIEVRMGTGVGPVRRDRRGLLLPRNNRLVMRVVRLVASDTRWLYPAALALAGEHAEAAPELRRAWREEGE